MEYDLERVAILERLSSLNEEIQDIIKSLNSARNIILTIQTFKNDLDFDEAYFSDKLDDPYGCLYLVDEGNVDLDTITIAQGIESCRKYMAIRDKSLSLFVNAQVELATLLLQQDQKIKSRKE